ncbi:MAG: B12-binding domain-containing radical SAM protein [bacterium]|nr:B12-binding domain-containing radical SAM protein [bacterium]
MKALFISPKYPETFWSFKHALKFVPGKKTTHPPLGLLTVAAMTPGDWEKRVVDLNVSELGDEDLEWADYAFVSATQIQKASTAEIIDRCRNAGVKTIAGGPYFTSTDDDFEDIDHLILNEAEITLRPFLEDMKNGGAKHVYRSEQFADVHETPVPAWDLVDRDKYVSMSIQFSRGCPFDCNFCDITKLFGRNPRTKTKEQILAELDNIYRLGWREGVFFVDDNLIGKRRELKEEVLPAVVEWMENHGHPFSFTTQISIDLSDDDELMDMMYRAGFDVLFVGIETPSDEGLSEAGKPINRNRDMVEAVKRIQSYGFQVQGGFIVGFDSDTPAIFDQQIEFIQMSNIVVAMVGLLNALHGTRLYNQLKAENRLTEVTSGDNTDFATNFIPVMPLADLEAGYKHIVKTIYSPRYYYRRLTRYLFNHKLKAGNGGLEWRKVRALVKSVVLLGIIGRERYYYWKLFFTMLLKKPKAFPLAITFAIYGYHFRKVFDAY